MAWTASTAKRDTKKSPNGLLSGPMADNEVIYKGDIVRSIASGYWSSQAAPATGDMFVGVATETVDNTGTGHAAGAKNITVDSVVPEKMPMLLADPLRLKQIIINLLGNAVKFTPEWGKVRLEAAVHTTGMATISVSDTGPGMDAEEIDTAMSPFGQVDSGFNKKHEGTGLGLPIALALARLHGGDLQIHSTKGVGTRVSVFIPLAAAAPAAPPPTGTHLHQEPRRLS